jgi:hypothetical protein
MAIVKMNDDYTLTITLSGMQGTIALDDGFRLRDALSRTLRESQTLRQICRRAWRRIAREGYHLDPAFVRRSIIDGDHYLEIVAGRRKAHHVDVEGFISLLPPREHPKARDVFDRWLPRPLPADSDHKERT